TASLDWLNNLGRRDARSYLQVWQSTASVIAGPSPVSHKSGRTIEVCTPLVLALKERAVFSV
ncbi:MAG TPA: hypothetical protein P5333_13560, partial [Caldilinea sp.]|nr:hypothetical protein [Caldilinea sp.]